MALRYFLACWIGASCLVSGVPLKYGLLGQKVHLQPHIPGHPDDIRWRHDGSEVVKFNGNEERVTRQYQSRVTLDWVSAELDITDLRHEDSGNYELETYVNNEMHSFQYTLEVIDKVTKPSVSCEMNSSDTRGDWATLTCYAVPTKHQSLMKYEWESGGNVLPGPQLTILLEDEPDDKIYTCRVSNPLTFETTTFSLKTCYSVKSSSVALAVSLSLIFLFLLLLLLAVVFCKLKNKACFAKSNRDDVEKNPSSTEERDRDDERAPCLDRATTLPSNQRLRSLVRAPSDTETDLPDDNHREHEAADLDKGEESKREEDEIEDEKSLANGLSPPSLPVTLNSPDKETEVTAGEYEDDANLEQVHGETESHSPDLEKSTEPDESTEEDRPSETVSREHHPKLSEVETRAKEDDQPEMDKNVSGDNRESGGEEPENLCEDTSQSPTPKNTDITQTNTFEKSLNAALPDPDPQVEGESRHESECEGQSDSSAAEEDAHEGKTEEDRPSTAPEQDMPETASGEHHPKLSEGETREKEDDQSEMDETVSGDNSESDGEETEDNLYSDTSQSPTPKNTDNTQIDTLEKSQNAALPDPDPQVEGESRHDSDCEGQSDSSAAEEEEGEGKTEEDRPSTSPEQDLPETASGEHHSQLSEEETQAKEDDQSEMDKTVSGDNRESDGEEPENLCEDTSQSPTPKNTDNSQTNTLEKSPNAALPDPDPQVEGESRHESECEGQSDSSAAEEDAHEGKTEEDRPSTSPEQDISETASGEHHSKLSEGETHAKEDDQPEMDKTVSGDNRESDREETEKNLYSDTSQSPTPKNTDNTQTDTFEMSPNSALPDPDPQVEGESRHESEREGQSDSSAAEEEEGEGKTEEKTKDECDPKEEKPDNKSESEDKEGQKTAEAVEK